MKKVYGAAVPLCENYGLSNIPPVESDFQIGDKVIYTNDAGIKFDMDIIGFSKDITLYGRFIHLVRRNTNGEGNAWWFPHHPKELCLDKKED